MRPRITIPLTPRDVKAIKRGLVKVQAGLHLIAAVMATCIVAGAVKAKPVAKRKYARKAK